VLAGDWETMAARYTEDAVRMPPSSPAIEGRDAIRRTSCTPRHADAIPPKRC
jgi:ketosteroid isomerase-like protein